MPRKHIPKLRCNKPSGRAFVELNGRRVCLGKYGEPETEQAYHRTLTEWAAHGRQLPPEPAQITVFEVAAYWAYAEKYHVKPDGTPTSTLDGVKKAIQGLTALYGETPAAEF